MPTGNPRLFVSEPCWNDNCDECDDTGCECPCHDEDGDDWEEG